VFNPRTIDVTGWRQVVAVVGAVSARLRPTTGVGRHRAVAGPAPHGSRQVALRAIRAEEHRLLS
jgi:hypothetical protein